MPVENFPLKEMKLRGFAKFDHDEEAWLKGGWHRSEHGHIGASLDQALSATDDEDRRRQVDKRGHAPSLEILLVAMNLGSSPADGHSAVQLRSPIRIS